MKKDHRSKGVDCDNCDMVFMTQCRLKKHVRDCHNKRKIKTCHYFNSGKECPFHLLGCKFIHKYAEACKYGDSCRKYMCQFMHQKV